MPERNPSNVVLCTVGTSLLKSLKALAEKGQLDPAVLESRNAIAVAAKLREFDPTARECGAEINSLTSMDQKGYLDSRDKRALYLLVSDTDEGQFIGEVLRLYYQDEFSQVEVRRLTGLHDRDFQAFRRHGLRHLVQEMAHLIKAAKHRGHRPAINATGGFKAQISFAGLVGQTLEVPVYYQFEKFSEVIEMPPMPVDFNYSLWLEHFELLEDLSREREGVPLSDSRLRRLDPRLEPLLEQIGEAAVTSAMGDLFHTGFKERFWREGAPLLPRDNAQPPEQRPVTCEKGPFGQDRPPGLRNYLENRVRHAPYVTRVDVFYYNPDLPTRNAFRLSSHGDDRIEGSFSDGKATAKFNVYLTEADRIKAQAAVVDLTNRFCG
jgi:putative CRISPR-associated protein (TIGR02619 family)